MTEPEVGAAAPAAPPAEPVFLTPQMVREKTFTSTRFKPGYDEDEVDDFLDEVEHTLSVLHQELAALRDELTVARTQSVITAPAAPVMVPVEVPAPVAVSEGTPGTQEMEEMLRRTLMLAQRTADQAVAEAREQAEATLAEARTEAQRVVTDARGRAEAAEREAAARSTALIAESDAQRRSVETKVEALRAFEREYRSRLRAYFELQLRELEGVGVPGGAPAPTEQVTPPPVFVPEPVAAPEVSYEPEPAPAEEPAPLVLTKPVDGPVEEPSATVVGSAPPVPGASGVPVPPPITAPAVTWPAETTFADLSNDSTPPAE